MTRSRVIRLSVVILISAFIAVSAQAQIGTMVANWTVPSSGSSSSSSGLHHSRALGDVTFGLAFIGVTPCRVVDTRGPVGPFGGPSLPAASPRSFTIPAGPCTGIPATAAAYSLNITVTNTLGPGFISLYPTGGSAPLVSTLNYVGGQTIANAAIVPSGTSAAVTAVAGVSGTDLIIDINGYYVGKGSISPLNPNEYVGFQGNNPGGPIVFGWNTSASGFGVWGYSNGFGVMGTSIGSGLGVAGVWGTSTDAIGTYGASTNTNGMWAQSTNFDALAAFGGREGAFIQGARNGAIIVTTSTATDTNGVFGADGASASGGLTTGWFSTGVRGQGKNGVLGISSTSGGDGVIGVAISPATVGVRTEGNFTATGTKAFIEPHPTDPALTIRYVALEGPEAGTYFRGTARTVNREAVIQVPESFRMVTDKDGLTVQLTPVGDLAQMAVMSQDLNQITVRSSRDVSFHYQVNGIRHAFKDWPAVAEGDDFRPISADQKMPGWLTEEAKSRLIANGTYNADGTVNMNTAERLGWAKTWREQAAAAAVSHK